MVARGEKHSDGGDTIPLETIEMFQPGKRTQDTGEEKMLHQADVKFGEQIDEKGGHRGRTTGN